MFLRNAKDALKGTIMIIRPVQWYKNTVVFLPILFSRNFFGFRDLSLVALTFVAFCLLSGTVYIINDLKDLEKDKLHPEKRKRPLPSGMISKLYARSLVLLFGGVSVFLLSKLPNHVVLTGITYLFLNILYSYLLKRFFLVDIITISFGYVLRTIAGAQVIKVPVSNWLIFSVFQVALILTLHKRRCELNIPNSSKHRDALNGYTPELILNLSTMLISSLLVTYSIYINEVNPQLIFTIPVAFYGLFRFEYLILKCKTDIKPQYPRDIPLIVTLVTWVIMVIILLYS